MFCLQAPQSQAETVDQNNNNAHQSNGENNPKLPPVEERDELSSTTGDTKTMKTPVRNSVSSKTPEKKSTGKKTPSSIVAPRPPMGEMHPSKVHQSTTKQADSGLLLGFNPVKKDANGNVVKDSVVQDTPSKARASPSSQYGTPGFEFKFASQESQLSDEAKKLMESLRSDAARIKSQIVEENKDKPAEEARDKDQQRRIAMPKGMAGRFSDVHMAQFKKMDSIANHPSAFRATPGRFQPVVEASSSKTLKRTKSKARLDEPESQHTSPSKPSPAPAAASSAKRVKQGKTDDASTRRPASEESNQAAPAAATAPPAAAAATPRRAIQPPRARSSVRSSLMTPTKASMARASSASVKPPKKPSMIPAPTQSPVAKAITMVTPRTPQTEFNPRLKTSLPSFANLKSILRRRQPLFSKDPSKIASGTHSAAPDFTPDLLLGGSNGPDGAAQTPSPKKRVGFSPSVKSPREQPPASPSPSKIPTSASARASSNITYPTLPALTPEEAKSRAPTVRHVSQTDDDNEQQSGPEVPGVMHGINNKKRHRVEPDDDATNNTENMPPAETTPNNERSAKRVKLGTPIKVQQPPTPTPIKGRVHPASNNTPLRTGGRGSTAGTPASARKSRGFVTSNRLNMLAQPKHR